MCVKLLATAIVALPAKLGFATTIAEIANSTVQMLLAEKILSLLVRNLLSIVIIERSLINVGWFNTSGAAVYLIG